MTSPATTRVFGVGAVEGRQHCPGRNLCSPCRCISRYRPPICGTSSKTWAQKMHCIPRCTQQWVILVASRSCGLCLDAHVIGFSTPSMATWIVSLETCNLSQRPPISKRVLRRPNADDVPPSRNNWRRWLSLRFLPHDPASPLKASFSLANRS